MGARVGDRAIGAASRIAEKARIIHIDIDPAEIGKNIGTSIPVVGDVKLISKELLEIVKKGCTDSWTDTLSKVKSEHPLRHLDGKERETVKPQYLLSMLAGISGDNTIIATEVGQNQIWAANNFNARMPGTFITSGGLGTMGYGLPAGIGAKIGNPANTVVVVAGDGSFQMSMPELGTIKQNGLGIKIIVLNNSRLGMVREIQKNKYNGRYSQVFLEHNPDFVRLAEAYGFKAEKITDNTQIDEALGRLLANDETYLLECIVDPEELTV
jgi:acetolactate synthase-1/2/3 large subunit